jgi:hypothetical protein
MVNKTKEEAAKDFEIERYELATGRVHPDKLEKPEVKEVEPVKKEEESPSTKKDKTTKKDK